VRPGVRPLQEERPSLARTRSLALIVLAALVAGLVPARGFAQSFGDDIDRLLQASRLPKEVRLGVAIIDVESGQVLGSARGDEAFIPASNQKLLTTGAALVTLGPDFVFRTEVVVDGDRVILRGSGDPALGDPELLSRGQPRRTVGDLLDVMALAATRAGLSGVREIVVDDRIFDRQLVHPSWLREHLTQTYGAPVAGVNFHENVITLYLSPSREGAGAPPRVRRQPDADWVEVDTSKSRTVKEGSNDAYAVRVTPTRFQLTGQVRTEQAVSHPIDHPALMTGRLLAARIQAGGIPVGGETSRPAGREPVGVRLADPLETLPAGTTIAAVTTSLHDVLKRCNADSENLYAEALMKRVAHAVTGEPGTWESGAAVMRMIVSERLGPAAAASTTIIDGSGLARENTLTPATLAAWLVSMARDTRLGPAFMASLATPGEGTLKTRFNDSRLRGQLAAKSGYIKGVRSLSGYVTGESGRRIAFVILFNDLQPGHHAAAGKLTNDLVAAIDRRIAAPRPQEQAKVGG